MNLPAAESIVLASIIESNGSSKLPTSLAGLLDSAPESFDDARHGQIANAIKELKLNGKPVHAAAVAERLDFEDSTLYLMNLMGSAMSLELAEYEAVPIWEAFCSRKTKSTISDSLVALDSAPNLQASIIRHTISTLERLNRNNGNGHNDGLPEILDCSKLLPVNPTMPELLIDGLLHKGSKMSLGGSSKSFKSWTFLSIATAIATGSEWLGMRTTKAKVLYVNFEIQPAFLHKRLQVVCDAQSLRPEPGYLDIWNLRGYSAPHTVIIPKIISRTKESGYGLVILDPSYKLIETGSDENSATDVAAMMNSFELITTQTGASVAYGAHFAKGNASAKEAIDRVSGSGVFARDPDSIINFTKHQEQDCFTVECILRNLPPIEPFVVAWQYPQFSRQDHLDPGNLQKKPGPPKCAKNEDVKNLLLDHPLNTKDWEILSIEKLHISRASFHRIKGQLSQNQEVLLSRINNLWTVISKS